MKRILLAAAAAMIGTAAMAADMPLKAPPPSAPVPSWTGFYLGLDVGGAWGRDDVSPVVPDGGLFPRVNRLNPSGVMGGVTGGYNWQTGNIVLGLEGDLGGMDLAASALETVGIETHALKSGLYGDVTGRAGFVAGSALLYGKGGWAFYDGRGITTTLAPGFTANQTSTFQGWTAGGGLEYKLTPSWSAKVEYLHFDFGTRTSSLTGAAGVFLYTNKLSADTVKVGLNWAFGH